MPARLSPARLLTAGLLRRRGASRCRLLTKDATGIDRAVWGAAFFLRLALLLWKVSAGHLEPGELARRLTLAGAWAT